MAYGVLGVGAIGAAIVTGLCENVDEAPEVLLSPRNAGIAAGLVRRFASVEVAAGNQAVVDGARVVVVCLRPQVAQSVLAELRFPADRVVISAMAFEAFSASSATIAAHFRYLDTIASWLESQAIAEPAATRYVASMFAGLAAATRSGERFERLAREHATSGGINEQFLNGLEQGGTFEHVSLGLQRILDRLNAS